MTEQELDHIWEQFRKNPTKKGLKEKILMHYIPLVRLIAGRMMISLPNSVILDDLVSSGLLGLINAIEKFDESKGVKFKTFANIKIKGAILDGLREMDWMPRGLREKSNFLEQGIKLAEKKAGRAPTDLEIAEALNLTMDDYFQLLNEVKVVSLLSLDNSTDLSGDGDRLLLETVSDTKTKTPDEIIEREELRTILVESIKELKDVEKNVIALYYYEQLTLKEIGEVMSLSESRVSQIHTKVIVTLRNKIKEYFSGKK